MLRLLHFGPWGSSGGRPVPRPGPRSGDASSLSRPAVLTCASPVQDRNQPLLSRNLPLQEALRNLSRALGLPRSLADRCVYALLGLGRRMSARSCRVPQGGRAAAYAGPRRSSPLRPNSRLSTTPCNSYVLLSRIPYNRDRYLDGITTSGVTPESSFEGFLGIILLVLRYIPLEIRGPVPELTSRGTKQSLAWLRSKTWIAPFHFQGSVMFKTQFYLIIISTIYTVPRFSLQSKSCQAALPSISCPQSDPLLPQGGTIDLSVVKPFSA